MAGWWLIGMMLLAALAGCSRPADEAAGKPATADASPQSSADLARLYDPARLVELRSLRGFPPELRELLGVNAAGHARMADIGDECGAPEDQSTAPGRCFLMGGISRTGAIVAFKAVGYPGSSQLAEAFVRSASGWTAIRHWRVGAPASLVQLLEMIRLADADGKTQAALDSCFRVVDGKCSY